MQIPPLSKSLHTKLRISRRLSSREEITKMTLYPQPLMILFFWGGLSNAGSGGSVANPDKIGGASSAKPENARGMAITTKLDC